MNNQEYVALIRRMDALERAVMSLTSLVAELTANQLEDADAPAGVVAEVRRGPGRPRKDASA